MSRAATGTLPQRFDDPGLPPHVPRQADHDESAAKRAERQVAVMFGLSIVSTVAFLVAYFAVDQRSTVFFPGIGSTNAYHLVLGVTLALSLLIGLGAVHWAKTLMPDHEVVEERHPLRSSDEDREHAVATSSMAATPRGYAAQHDQVLPRCGALGLFSLPLVLQVAGSLGPTNVSEARRDPVGLHPHRRQARGQADPAHARPARSTPIKAEEVAIGSIPRPPGKPGLAQGGERRGRPGRVEGCSRREGEGCGHPGPPGPEGLRLHQGPRLGLPGRRLLEICTHVGCPVGLYEQKTHNLLCPCHQSTFDVTRDCEVVFGPAKRAPAAGEDHRGCRRLPRGP